MKRYVSLISALTITAGLVLGMLGMSGVGASSHREAPLISNDPAADTTDMYVFRSPDAPDTVTAIMNVWPFQEPSQGPNWYLFDPNVRYSMHITNDGDPDEEIRLDFRFRTEIRGEISLLNSGPIMSLDDPNFLTRQFYSVDLVSGGQTTRLGENLPVPPPNIGPKSFPNGYDAVANQAIKEFSLGGGAMGKVFAGPRDDPFFIDIGAAFDLFNTGRGIPTGAQPGIDNLAGFNILSLAVQVPIAAIVRPECTISDPNDMDCVVGMWITTSRPATRVLRGESPPTTDGDWVQVSRLSAALVNELVVPTAMKDAFNASNPENDERFLGLVQDPIPAKLLQQLFSLETPPTPREDLVTIFLTGIPGLNQPPNVEPAEIAHLNLAVPVTANPNRLGLLGDDRQGYPNGRRLADDVTDISLRASAGGTPFTAPFNKAPNNQLSDGVNQNDKPFLSTFPYVASPHAGYAHQHDGGGGAPASQAAPPAQRAAQPAQPASPPAQRAAQPASQSTPAAQPAALPRTGDSGLGAAALLYTVQKGDTVGSISTAVYGSADHVDEIISHNLEVLSSPDGLTPGTILVLPLLDEGDATP